MAIALAAFSRVAAAARRRHRDSTSNQKRRQEPETHHNFTKLLHFNSPFLKFCFFDNAVLARESQIRRTRWIR